MQRVICRDLVEMFWTVHWIATCPMGKDEELEHHRVWQQLQVKNLLKFTIEEHVNSNPDVYLQLKERGAAEMTYRQLHQLVDDPKWLSVNLSSVISVFSNHVQEGYLPTKSLRRAVGSKGLKGLIATTSEIYARDQAALKAIMARRTEAGTEP